LNYRCNEKGRITMRSFLWRKTI